MTRKCSRTFAAILLIVSVSSWSNAADPDATTVKTAKEQTKEEGVQGGGYLIGAGDVLDILVWKDEVLTRTVTVRPDGYISYPLLGDIDTTGKTIFQLKGELEKKLAHYIPDVTLSIDAKQINSMTVYVIGKVNAPGRFNLNTDINVLQALATAGGLNVFAKRNRIKIFRVENGRTHIFPFEYDSVVDGKNMEQNICLKRGDVVVIP